MATEQEQLQALTAQVQQLTSVMMDLDRKHAQEIQQRDIQLAEMRGTLTALNARGSRTGPSRSELLDPKILHKVQPFDGQRTTWKTFEFQWRAYLIAQDRKYRELLEKIDDPTEDVRNIVLDVENQELSMQLYFALVLVMPRESVGELIVRNVNQGEGAMAWRQILGEYASTEPGNVLAMWSKLGDLRFPQGSDIVVGINRMEEDMTRYQKMAGENLSDTIKRGILMKALTNETELQKHVFRNSTRLDTYAKMRQEVMSALTAERAVHEPMGDDPMEIGAVGKSGKKGKGKKGKGKNDQKGGGKGPGQGKGTGTPNPHADRECFYCHRKGHIKEECRIRIADEKDSKSKDEKDKGKDKRSKQKEKKRVNALEGNQGTCSNNNSQGEVQATVGALQARMIFAVRATHGTTTNSSETVDGDIPERMRLAPLRNALMLDSGAQVSAVPRQQIDELHYNLGPSNVTGLKGISGEDIPRYGHVELNLRRGQDVVQVGAEVADIEHGIIATDAIVKRGRSVLHSPAGHWIVDGTLELPSQTTAIKLRTHQANYYLEFDEILKQDETNQGQSVAAMRRGYRARQPAEASQGTLPRTMGPESSEQTTLPTRALKSPGQPSVEEKTAHEMHHLPYRPWCPECVEARGVDDPHHRQPALDELATPKVMFDIFFVGPDEMAKKYKIMNGCFSLRDKERLLSSQELDLTIAVLNLVDCKTNAQGTLLANKELDEYKVNYIVAMLDYWGHTTTILQTVQVL